MAAVRRRARSTRTASRCPRRPRSPRRARPRRRASRRGASRSPRAAPRRRARRPRRPRAPRRRSSARRRSRRAGSCARRKPAHWPERLRVRVDRADLVGRDRLRGGRGSRSPCGRARRRSRTSGASNTSASSVAPTAPSREFSIGTSPRSTLAVLDGADDRRHGRQRDRLDVERRRRPARRASWSPAARGRRRASAPRAPRSPRSPASARRIASSSSGESRCSPRPSTTCLQYSRAVSRWAIEESTTPLRSRVEQRERGRLVAGQLAVGVVADERAVGDRAVEPLLGLAHPLLEPPGDLLDAVVQLPERLLQPRRVVDEVLAPAARRARPAGRPAGAARAAPAPPRSRARSGRARRPTGPRSRPDRSGRPRCQRIREGYCCENSASYSALLLSVFSSPGHRLDLDRDGHGVSNGGGVSSAERRRGLRAGGDRGDVARSRGSAPGRPRSAGPRRCRPRRSRPGW